jgi:hypothetical protein
MLSALASAAILVAQCTGPYCAPDTDFERPTLGAMGTAAAPALAVAADGATLLLWEARLDGEPDVLFSRREPGAAGRWLEVPVRLDTDAPGASRSIEPRLAVGPNERVYAVWQDARNGRDAVFFSLSTNGGLAWSPQDVRLGEGEAIASMPSLVAAGDAVYVAWEDLRDGERDLRLTRSADGGATWTEAVRVGTDDAGRAASYHPLLTAWDGGGLLVTWWDERDGLADVYVRRSGDGGLTWAAPETRIDPGDPGAVTSRDARISVAGDRVVIAWQEGGDGAPTRLVTRASEDRGATWGPVQDAGRGRDPVPVVGTDRAPWVAWLVEDSGSRVEKTSIGGRIVEVPRPVRFELRSAGMPGPRAISSLPGPASAWLGASSDRYWAVRTGSLVGRAVLEVYEHRGVDWRSALQLRFGLDLIATDVEITAHSLRGAIGPDGVVHVAWIADYDGTGDVGYFRLQP